MRMVNRALYWMTAVAAVLVTFWLGYTRTPEAAPVAERVVPVEGEPVGTGSIEQTVELTGWIVANKRVEVASKVAGRVESLSVKMPDGSRRPVEVGLFLTQGQPLAVIDHDVHLAQVAAAKAEVKAKQVQLEEAERESKRVAGLFESGSVTEQARDQAKTAADLAAAGLNLATANLDLAQISLRESTITAPIDGVITAKHIDEGNLVAQGQRIVSVADIKVVKVLAAVPERYSPQIRQGMPVKIALDALKGREIGAEVYSVYPAFDEKTHTIEIEIRVQNDDLQVRPGMFARVKLILDHRDNVIVVPRDVILGGKIDPPYVYVVENGLAKKCVVGIGLMDATRCEITSGLERGASLVVNGMHLLADGLRVEVVRLEDIE